MDNFLAVLRMLVRACEEGKLTHWNKWVFLFDCVGGHDELSDHHSHCCVQTSPANHSSSGLPGFRTWSQSQSWLQQAGFHQSYHMLNTSRRPIAETA